MEGSEEEATAFATTEMGDNDPLIIRSGHLPHEYTSSAKDSTFVMDVSPSVVGWIIGRSGLRIKEIQAQTGCKMWLDQDVPDDQPRKIFFHGSTASIEDAVARVSDLVQFAPILANSKIAAGHNLTSTIFDCPPPLVGMVIGKKGWTIKKIQEVSGAQISINQSVREGLPRKVIVSGDEEAVSRALELIGDLVRDKASLLKIELPSVLTSGRTNLQPLRNQGIARQHSSPSFHSSSKAIHQDPYLIFADHEPPPPSISTFDLSRSSLSEQQQSSFFMSEYHPQPLYRASHSVHRVPTPPPPSVPSSRPQELLRLNQRHDRSAGLLTLDPRDNRTPVSDSNLPLTSSLLHNRNYPPLYHEASKYSGSNYAPPSAHLQQQLNQPTYLSFDHPNQPPPTRQYQHPEMSAQDSAARRSMRSHSAGSIGHLYELDEGTQQLLVAPPHASSSKPVPLSSSSIIQHQQQGQGYYKEVGGGSYEDSRPHTTRSTSQRIFFNQPPSAQDANSPRSVGRGYSFASSKSEFHSFETSEVVSVPSVDSSHASTGYRRHSTMFPMRSSEGFTSGEFTEADHSSVSQMYPQRLPSPPVQLDLPAWHAINRNPEGK
jgi:predicted RNA-binding protein YlqC (UPF0109 family)